MPDCGNCGAKDVVSRHIHEAALDRMERVNRRWFIAWLVTFVLLVGAVCFFFWYESQFETVETYEQYEQEADGNGSNTVVRGNMYYGEANGQDQNAPEETEDGR